MRKYRRQQTGIIVGAMVTVVGSLVGYFLVPPENRSATIAFIVAGLLVLGHALYQLRLARHDFSETEEERRRAHVRAAVIVDSQSRSLPRRTVYWRRALKEYERRTHDTNYELEQVCLSERIQKKKGGFNIWNSCYAANRTG
jgi:hypothetical protein